MAAYHALEAVLTCSGKGITCGPTSAVKSYSLVRSVVVQWQFSGDPRNITLETHLLYL